METWVDKVGMVSAIALPFFNIPLIIRLVKRKSARDFSVAWALGVWICIVGMTPDALQSQDETYRVFGIFNIFFFSIVTFLILKYRHQ